MKHTKTPWDLESRPMEVLYRIGRKTNGIGIAYCYDEQDAEFIVRACNAHDDLVFGYGDSAKTCEEIANIINDKFPEAAASLRTLALHSRTAIAKAVGE